VCVNSRRAIVSEVDQRELSAIERTILSPDAVNYVVDRVVERVLTARRTAPDRCKEIDVEIKRLRRELDRFVALIANERAPEQVLEEIADREHRAKKLEAEFARLQLAPPTSVHIANIRELALARAKHLRSTLYADVGRARHVLQQLLVGPIAFKLEESGYRLEGETRVGALFAPDPAITRIRVASPRGCEPQPPYVVRRCANPASNSPLAPAPTAGSLFSAIRAPARSRLVCLPPPRHDRSVRPYSRDWR
jgi:hypothetical protein